MELLPTGTLVVTDRPLFDSVIEPFFTSKFTPSTQRADSTPTPVAHSNWDHGFDLEAPSGFLGKPFPIGERRAQLESVSHETAVLGP